MKIENKEPCQHLLVLQKLVEDTSETIDSKRQEIAERLKAAAGHTAYKMIDYLLTRYPNGYMGEGFFLRFVEKNSPPVYLPSTGAGVFYCGENVSSEEAGEGSWLSFSDIESDEGVDALDSSL